MQLPFPADLDAPFVHMARRDGMEFRMDFAGKVDDATGSYCGSACADRVIERAPYLIAKIANAIQPAMNARPPSGAAGPSELAVRAR